MARGRLIPPDPRVRVRVGEVELKNPVMLASGTAGYGAELADYLDLGGLGAVVTKSLAAFEWVGNPAPRMHPTTAGMLNAVGLQGGGVEHWLAHDLPALMATGATVVASIWGRSVDDYAAAAALMSAAPEGVVAVEVNLSCPNLKGHGMFAQSATAAAEVISACSDAARPLWAKLTAAVTDLPSIAGAVAAAGASAVTLINTLPALAIDVGTMRPALGNGSGGLSGPAIHPVAVKAVWDVHVAHPELPIVGVGGVVSADDVIELMLAGASAVQIGTATFANPRAAGRIARMVGKRVRDDGRPLAELTGRAHRRS